MKNVLNKIKAKGKIIFMPIAILLVLISIIIFNGFQKNNSVIVNAKDGTYIESSGIVESNAVSVSSEVTGTVLENLVKEGDKVKKGDVIAKINSTSIKNQYDQAMINANLLEKNIELLQDQIQNFKSQNEDAVKQAQGSYLSVRAEYEKVMDGASLDEIKQVEEAVSQAKINLDFTKTNLDRSEYLLGEEAISQSKYDEALKSYNIAIAQFNSASSQLNLVSSYPTNSSAKAAESKMNQAQAGYEFAVSNGDSQLSLLEGQLEIAILQYEQAKSIVEQNKIELEKSTIKSPMDGIVNSLLIKQGEFVQMGKLSAEVYDPDNVEIKVYVSEANIGYIMVGQNANIYIDSDNNKTYEGKVVRINNEAEFTPKNIQTKEERVNTVFEVKILVLDSSGTIKPGMPADVNIKID